jgi:pyruvate/2-oxoglutarate dehydrogenase complex dihydrolipoamide acyltransferase (E2) component
MPILSGSMESGVVSHWRVAVGERVEVGQIIAEIESDKAVLEYESPEAGTVVRLIAMPGVEVQVGAPMLELAITS